MAKTKKDLSTVKAVYNNLRSGTRKDQLKHGKEIQP